MAPSLAENNSMRQRSKADMMGCLGALAPIPEDTTVVDMKSIDGAALMYTIDPKKSNVTVKTGGDFSQLVLLPYVERQLQSVERLDFVWDVYKAERLKSSARQRRGMGESLRVAASTRLPSNWQTFLRVDSNKTGFFNYLAHALKAVHPPEGKVVLTTRQEDVISNPESDVSQIAPCAQEEADGRMVLHAAHAHGQDHCRIMIQATDTYVVVLAITIADTIQDCELYIAFGHGKTFRYISAHAIAAQLCAESSQGLLFLHAISGCDTVSAFCGIAKMTAWDIWRALYIFKSLFSRLSQSPSQISDDDKKSLERFEVLLCKRTSTLQNVNEARKRLFAFGIRQLKIIPLTSSALLFPPGHVWGKSIVANASVPSPSVWGWERIYDAWTPTWSTLQKHPSHVANL
jgi:hypothetical protein